MVHLIGLIPAYALDCLDEDETAQVAEHLKGCQECQLELCAYQAVVDQLPLAVPQAEPSPRVKTMLLRRVGLGSPVEKQPSAWVRLTNSIKAPTPIWRFAGVALVLVLLLSNVALWRQVNWLRSNPGSTALRVVNLDGTQFSPGATGMIVISQNGEYGTLVVDHLPALNSEQEYQLWLVKDENRTNGGTFSVSPEGYASLVIAAPHSLDDYEAFGVTIEPAGGSAGPTGEKVLGGNL
jgi:anti-sigma-K factor RskA